MIFMMSLNSLVCSQFCSYFIYIVLHINTVIGAVDCIKKVNETLWKEALDDESQSPPPFYSHDFQVNALQCIRDGLGISHDEISTTNMKRVYLHLILHFVERFISL